MVNWVLPMPDEPQISMCPLGRSAFGPAALQRIESPLEMSQPSRGGTNEPCTSGALACASGTGVEVRRGSSRESEEAGAAAPGADAEPIVDGSVAGGGSDGGCDGGGGPPSPSSSGGPPPLSVRT